MKKIKVAIIGYGGMGGWHADHIREMEKFELAGAWDINPQQLENARRKGVHAYASLEELLAELHGIYADCENMLIVLNSIVIIRTFLNISGTIKVKIQIRNCRLTITT